MRIVTALGLAVVMAASWRAPLSVQAEESYGGPRSINFLSSGSLAPTLSGSVELTPDELTSLAHRLKALMDSFGISGVSLDIQGCYNSILKWTGEERQKRILYCVTEDKFAYSLDVGFRAALKRQFGVERPPSPYFTPDEYKDRIQRYLRCTTPDRSIPNLDRTDDYVSVVDKEFTKLLN